MSRTLAVLLALLALAVGAGFVGFVAGALAYGDDLADADPGEYDPDATVVDLIPWTGADGQ